MPQYSHPGVYVQEVQGGPAPISGNSPSTCAMIGFTLEGKTNEPILVQSLTEFNRLFGGFTSFSKLPTGANLFFTNGGQQLRVVRVVSSDAEKSSSELLEGITSEALTPDVALDGVIKTIVFTDDIISGLPIAKGSSSVTGLKIIEGGVGATNYFIDVNGDGSLVGKAIADNAIVAGLSGTVDYETGEVTLTYAVAPVATITYSADYSRVNLRFSMNWEGLAGDDFRVVLQGDPNYESLETGSFSRFIMLIDRKDADGVYETQESFDSLVLNDSSHSNFISTIINDENTGSNFLSVSSFVDTSNPSDLVGEAVSNESLTADPVFDGSASQFEFDLANSLSETSLVGSFNLAFIESLGAIVGALNSVTNATGGMSSVVKDILDADNVGSLSCTLAGLGAVTVPLSGDGSGTIAGTFANAGTTVSVAIDAEAGTYTFSSDNGDTFVAGVPFELTYVRANVLKLTDNDGLLEIASDSNGDDDIALDLNGTNTVTYGVNASSNGKINVKFKYLTDPSQGPALLAGSVTSASYYSQGDKSSLRSLLSGGSNGASVSRSSISSASLALESKGLYALNKIDDLLQVVIPDFESNSLVSQDLIDYCSGRKDRFAIVSVPEGYSYSEAIKYKKSTINRNSVSHSAIYYPHLKIIDPVTDREVLFPSGSAVAGIYARVDSIRNVSKAPAGTVDGALRGVTGVEFELSPAEVGETNLAHVNNIVNYPYTGLCVWGARSLQIGGDFPYIQMRRLFMFVEKAVFNSAQGFVFESNTAGLRLQIRAQLEAFLLGLFNSSHFAGNTPAQSFFVVCDDSNNTPASIAKGILFVDIGIAPTRPAEFIVFRFQQKTLD